MDEGVSLDCVSHLQVFRLPQLMLDAPEMSRVLAKARLKLLDLYGDLEKVRAVAAAGPFYSSSSSSIVARCLLTFQTAQLVGFSVAPARFTSTFATACHVIAAWPGTACALCLGVQIST
jgi:hypothetical protein